jgi:hypothetical protein
MSDEVDFMRSYVQLLFYFPTWTSTEFPSQISSQLYQISAINTPVPFNHKPTKESLTWIKKNKENSKEKEKQPQFNPLT